MNASLAFHIGNSRENQEDRALFGRALYVGTEEMTARSQSKQAYCSEMRDIADVPALFAVSDGMGGHACGEVASYLTVKYLADHYDRIAGSDKATLLTEIAHLNRGVVKAAQENAAWSGMGATLCGVMIKGGELLGFNVGDSRLYRYWNGELTQVSKDHTEGQRLLDLQLLTSDEIKSFSNRKSLYKYIGIKAELVADVYEIGPWAKGMVLLLCTDGLTDALSDFEIRAVLDSGETLTRKCERLLRDALGRNVGHGDNITMILIEF